jgi:GntR family transcriptional regulator
VDEPRRYLQIAGALRTKLHDGTCKPGEMVQLERLRHEHGVARQTAAKALRVLADEGLLTRYPGLGYYFQDDDGRPPRATARHPHNEPGSQPPPMAEQYITAPELAGRLRLSTMTVYQLIHDGEIEGAIRIGTTAIRIPGSSAQAFLERCRMQGQHLNLDDLIEEADGPRTSLDDGRSIVVERDGTITVYSADHSQYLIFQVMPSWEIDTIGLITESTEKVMDSDVLGEGPLRGRVLIGIDLTCHLQPSAPNSHPGGQA